MRTTLAIDDDVLAVAKSLASRQGKTVGEVVSLLARQGLARGTAKGQSVRNGLPLLAVRQLGTAVTLELVNQLRDELP